MIPDPHEGTEGHHEWQVRRRLVGSCLLADFDSPSSRTATLSLADRLRCSRTAAKLVTSHEL